MKEDEYRMSKGKYIRYGFDTKFEYRTYRNIGRQHMIQFYARKNLFGKLWNWIRNTLNRGEKKYRNFDVFTDWREYIIENYGNISSMNCENLIHYLQVKKRDTEFSKSSWGLIAVPCIICCVTAVLTGSAVSDLSTDGVLFMIAIEIAVVVFMSLRVYEWYSFRYHFYEDMIDVLKSF